MKKRRSEAEWMKLVKDFKSSGLNLIAWCKKSGISKSSIYPYIKRYENSLDDSIGQQWGKITFPNNIKESCISIKIGSVTLDIENGFNEETLSKILNVVLKVC